MNEKAAASVENLTHNISPTLEMLLPADFRVKFKITTLAIKN